MIKRSIISAITLVALSVFLISYTQAQDSQASKASKGISREDIYAVLENDPELLTEIIMELVHNQQRDANAQILVDFDSYLKGDTKAGTLGNPDGDVVIVEFFDYRCGYCRRDHAMVKALLAKDDTIKLVLKQYPILDREGKEPLSALSAIVALYVTDQGKFEAFHEAMIARPQPESRDDIFDVVEAIGLKRADAEQAIADRYGIDRIQMNWALGEQLAISGTPYYIIGSDFAEGAQKPEKFEALVKAARAEKTAK